jgi:serine protease Do
MFYRGLLVLALVLAAVAKLQAQSTDADAIAALERRVVAAVSEHQKSVVAIAVDRRRRATDEAPPIIPLDPARLRRYSPAPIDDAPKYFGSGVVVDRRGLILTNYHVLGHDDEDYRVEHRVTTIDRKTYTAKVKAADRRSDLAILELVPVVAGQVVAGQKGAPPIDLVPAKFGDADRLKKGQFVIVLGNPHAIARDGQPSAGWGIVANLQRKGSSATDASDYESPPRPPLHRYGTLIEVDARLPLGTSGGLLLNLDGEMIGLTTSRAALDGVDSSAGFAIPMNAAFRRIVSTLIEGREVEYGLLGITPLPLYPEEIHSGQSGVRIDRVLRGSPAERGGLTGGDIVTRLDGREVREPDELVLAISTRPPGAAIRLTARRGDRQREIDAVLSKFPPASRGVVTQRGPAWRGVRVDYPTAVLDLRALVEIPRDCVAVTEVATDSPAWKAGLRRETLITHVNNRPVDSPAAFRRAVQAARDTVILNGRTTSGEPLTVTLRDSD